MPTAKGMSLELKNIWPHQLGRVPNNRSARSPANGAQMPPDAPRECQAEDSDQPAHQVAGLVDAEWHVRLEQRRDDVETAAIVAQIGELEGAPVREAGGVPVDQHTPIVAQTGLVPGHAVVAEGEAHEDQGREQKRDRAAVRHAAGGKDPGQTGRAATGRKYMLPRIDSPGCRTRTPVSATPSLIRLNPSPIMLTGSTQK